MEVKEHKFENIYKPGDIVKFDSGTYYIVEKADSGAYVFKKIDDILEFMEKNNT